MKFARYLEETQTPEWKKAYIDYRGLKKLISAIQAARQHQQQTVENTDKADRPRSRSATPPLTPHKLTFEEPPEIALRRVTRMSVKLDPDPPPSLIGMGRGGLNRMSLRSVIPNLMAPLVKSRPTSVIDSAIGRRAELVNSLPLHEILTFLSPQEATFFKMLDNQLDKVEKFYCTREDEMLTRGRVLQTQLNELNEHRNRFLKAQTSLSWTAKLGFRSSDYSRSPSPETFSIKSPASPSPTFTSVLYFSPQDSIPSVAFSPSPSIYGKRRETDEENQRGSRDKVLMYKPSTATSALGPDPERYFSARRKLKKAVLEHYRGLELLDNYRIMNINGFRKIVKKFEKSTTIPVQAPYMREKVERSSFASGAAIKDMMKQMEEMFAGAFLNDDKKGAATRLRTVTVPQTQHLSTFRTGLYLGLAVPALVHGLYKVSQHSKGVKISQNSRGDFHAWEVLLYLYGVLFLPLVFALLVGLNLAGWAAARINYVFIFELDVLSRLDHRKYFEIPAFLLCTLIYSFWLSFNQIGVERLSTFPTLWLFIWVLFAIVVIINPLPIMHRSSRYWFLRSLGKQFLSGTRMVEFTDFWLGDQLCSMTFTLSHLVTFVCAYVHQFTKNDQFPDNLSVTCGTATNMWGLELILLCIPQVIRFIQSVKRYVDTPVFLHLINAGKYASGIVYTGFYLKWRMDENDRGASFALWCLWGVISSLYGCAWDWFMDWSLLSLRNKKYPYLRSELLYPNHVFVYYFAIVTNLVARFSWVSYIPKGGPDMLTRTFFVGAVELIRRFQWNFFRLENEHLGNVDQYRVTREVPLPYPLGSRLKSDSGLIKLWRDQIGQAYPSPS